MIIIPKLILPSCTSTINSYVSYLPFACVYFFGYIFNYFESSICNSRLPHMEENTWLSRILISIISR